MPIPSTLRDRLDRVAPWLSGAVLLALYAPVLAMGPVGEDLQWAYKGWITLRHPSSFLRPFHQHLRPAGRLFFTASANLFGDHWFLYRLMTLLAAACCAVLAYRFLKRTAGMTPLLAATGLFLWLGSPFSDEVLFVTNQVKQVLYVTGVLLVLSGRRERGRVPALQIITGAVLAFASKEEAVVLPALVFLQDLLLFRLPARVAVRRAVPWGLGALAYLAVYRSLVHFEAGWFYSRPWLAAPNLAATWGAFWHLHAPVLGRYVQALCSLWPATVAAVSATVALLIWSWRRGDGRTAFGFAAAVVALAPTLPANLQAPRYTFLAYLLFLSGILPAVGSLASSVLPRVAIPALAFTLAAVAVNDLVTARGDAADWVRYAALTRRVETEAGPVLEALRAGRTVAVIRGADRQPLDRLLRFPAGVPKLYFPRPDDPYGVTSLSALATWRLRREGTAAPRAVHSGPPVDALYLVHDVGLFREVPPAPEVFSHPFGQGIVILHPVPALSFDPDVFP